MEYNTTGSTENAKIKGHYTRLDFGFDTYSALSFFSFACHSHMASKTDNYRHHTKVSVSVCRVFASICECVCVCLPAAEASQETKLDKCHHTTAYHIFSKHHPIQHNTHSQQITHAQKSPFVIVCCFCCRRVFFHIQFHCMTYAFLPLMCLRSICINA